MSCSMLNELHKECASTSPSSLRRIRIIVRNNPEALKVRDGRNGPLPLHVACNAFLLGGGSLKVVQYLIEQWPESVQTSERTGCLPLHSICAFDAPLAVIQYLVEQWPEFVKAVDNRGFLPLHYVCRNQKARMEVIQYLVRQCLNPSKRSTVMKTYHSTLYA
jgi:hypothetical protein